MCWAVETQPTVPTQPGHREAAQKAEQLHQVPQLQEWIRNKQQQDQGAQPHGGWPWYSDSLQPCPMEDDHYKAKCEELQVQVENQQKIILDYQAELQRKEQVYLWIFTFDLSLS